MPGKDDDWEPFDEGPTRIDDPDPAETAPHRSLDYLAGREAGFTEGIEATLWSLGIELAGAGLSSEEARPILHRVRQAATGSPRA